MFGRFNEVEDKPDWREKLAEWRASPLWVPKRPDWVAEGPGVLAMLFVGIAFLMIAIVYLAIPPQTLPSSMPGHFTAAPPPTTVSTTSTTTTTLPVAVRLKTAATLKRLTPKQWAWLSAVAKTKEDFATQEAIAASPATPATRRWDFALITAVVAIGLLVGAWFVSDTRGRRHWAR